MNELRQIRTYLEDEISRITSVMADFKEEGETQLYTHSYIRRSTLIQTLDEVAKIQSRLQKEVK